MTLILELTEEEQARLRQKAEQHGLDEQAFLKMLINEVPLAGGPRPRTPAEAVAMWEREGILGTFGDRPDSPGFARQLREQAGRRRWT